MKSGTENKLKFKALKRRLGLPLWQAIGLLETLWRVTEANAPAGDLGKLSNEEIAAAMEWEGDHDGLIATLVEFRWLDQDDEFRLIVHDWSEHVSNYLKGGFIKYGRRFANEIAKERTKDGPKQKKTDTLPMLGSGFYGPTKPTYLPSQAIPSQAIESGAEAPREKHVVRFQKPTLPEVRDYCQSRGNKIDPEQFIDHYEARGWKLGGGQAMKNWQAAVRTWEKNDRAKASNVRPKQQVIPTAEQNATWSPHRGITE